MPTEDTAAKEQANFLVMGSESRHADCEKQAEEAQNAHKQAVIAVDAAKDEFAAAQAADETASEISEEEASVAERKAKLGTLEARVNDLQHVADEKKNASFAAVEALKAATHELVQLKQSAKAAAAPIRPIEAMVREELATTNKGLQVRRDKENDILDDAHKKTTEWLKHKETLGADIHRAELEVAVAKQSVQATKDLATAMKKDKMAVQ